MNLLRKVNSAWRHGDVQYVFKSGRYKVIKTVLQMGANFALIWYLSNYHSREFLGQFQYLIVSLIGLLSLFSFIGIHDSVIRSAARGQDASLVHGTRYAIKIGLSGSALLLGYAAFVFGVKGDRQMGAALIACALFFPFYRSLDLFASYLTAKQRFARECRDTSLVFVLRMLAAFGALWLFGENLWALIAAFIGTHVIVSAVFHRRCARSIAPQPVDPELIPFAWFNTMVTGLYMVANTLDQFLVEWVRGPEFLAIYSIGIILYEMSRWVVTPVFTVLWPRFADESMAMTGRKIVALLMAGCALALVSFLGFTIFVPWFFPKYPESIPIGQLISLCLILMPANTVCSIYFRAVKYERGIWAPTLSSRLFSTVLCLPFLLWGGLLGLAWMRIAEQILHFLLNLYYWNAEKDRPGPGAPLPLK